MQLVQYHDLGHISYQTAWDYQTIVQQKLLHNKLKFRQQGQKKTLHHLIICEHNPVYTLGKSGSMDNLLLSKEELVSGAIEFYPINRGGDITYHGPGQLTVYPIFDLECFKRDVHFYVRNIEQVVINTLAHFDIQGQRIKEFTGVWVDEAESSSKRKLCAIGIHLSRWVSLHGLALNVNTDLNYFDKIIPCGIDEQDKSVSSIQHELKKKIEISNVKQYLLDEFANIFELEYLKI